MTNRVLDADEALAWGLVTRVVPDDAVDAEAEALVAQLAAGPTGALAGTKRLLRARCKRRSLEQLGDEAHRDGARR